MNRSDIKPGDKIELNDTCPRYKNIWLPGTPKPAGRGRFRTLPPYGEVIKCGKYIQIRLIGNTTIDELRYEWCTEISEEKYQSGMEKR